MISIDYFSDILCVWAYGGQVRLDELMRNFGDDIRVRHRFIPLFADTRARIGEGWKEQGGFAGRRHGARGFEPAQGPGGGGIAEVENRAGLPGQRGAAVADGLRGRAAGEAQSRQQPGD